MNALSSILLLIILSIITQHVVSWAGSILHEVGNTEISYSSFTFRDDRHMPMTTNILMNICIPNVCMIFLFMFSRKFHFPYIENYLLCYIISFFVYRMFLICIILRRKEMYSIPYEAGIALGCICLALFLIHFFLSTEENIFITASELREELWFAILIILYQFFKQILNKKALQNKVLSNRQIKKYVTHKFQKFYNKYNHLLNINSQNHFLCIFLYAVMIFEDFNRVPVIRFLERIKIRLGKTATVGIMQLKSNIALSDEESVIQFYNNLENKLDPQMQSTFDESNIYDLAWEHNPDNEYVNNIIYIYHCLIQYINEVPKYRELFHMCTAYADNFITVNTETILYHNVLCNNINNFCQHIQNNIYINLANGSYHVHNIMNTTSNVFFRPVFEGAELIISNINNLHVHANDATIMTSTQYATVLSFINCQNITIEHLIAGHTPDISKCTGAVLQFENCANIALKHLELYGCGTYGIISSKSNITIENCKIHHCSHGGILLNQGHCVIDNIEISDCTDTLNSIINATDSNVIMSNSAIRNCSSQNRIIDSENSFVICHNVIIYDCNSLKPITNLENEDGINTNTTLSF